MKIGSSKILSLGLFVIFFPLCLHAKRAASAADDVGVLKLKQLDPTLTGTGIRVGQAEADTGSNAWEANPAASGLPAGLFSFNSYSGGTTNVFPNGIGSESGHADQVAGIFYGINGGVAPGVANVDIYNTVYIYGWVALSQQSEIPARVINQSFTYGTWVPSIDSAYDSYIALNPNRVFVSGVGNSGSIETPSGGYNEISVGAYNGSSSSGPTPDGRCKPDIIAPASATSFSTPIVSGVAALLAQAGLRDDGGPGTQNDATDSRTIKALLLNGATKPFGWFHTTTRPLHYTFGAGTVNAYNSYRNLTGGEHRYTTATTTQGVPNVSSGIAAQIGWDFNTAISTSSSDQVNHYILDLDPSQGSSFLLTATLVWARQAGKSSINNLDLYLYNSAGVAVDLSVSTVDNVEHLFTPYLPAGRYDLQVVKRAGTPGSTAVSNSETYALAFNFSTDSAYTPVISRTSNDVLIQFPTLTGHTYRVEQAATLSGSWTTLSSNLTGTGSTVLAIDPNAASLPAKYYRVIVIQ